MATVLPLDKDKFDYPLVKALCPDTKARRSSNRVTLFFFEADQETLEDPSASPPELDGLTDRNLSDRPDCGPVRSTWKSTRGDAMARCTASIPTRALSKWVEIFPATEPRRHAYPSLQQMTVWLSVCMVLHSSSTRRPWMLEGQKSHLVPVTPSLPCLLAQEESDCAFEINCIRTSTCNVKTTAVERATSTVVAWARSICFLRGRPQIPAPL